MILGRSDAQKNDTNENENIRVTQRNKKKTKKKTVAMFK